MIVDKHGRGISYLRLSITDRCNLRCFYCQGVRGKLVSHHDILRYEDMEKLLYVASELDIKKVRLTGGEPFLRRNFFEFLEKLTSKFPEFDFRITTNGTITGNRNSLVRLKEMGLKGLNVSLDTFSRDKFVQITGKDLLSEVLNTIYLGVEIGLRIKVNAVALKGINDSELKQFVQLAIDYPVDVRFIEFMPVGEKTLWKRDYFWSAEEILQEMQKIVELTPVQHKVNSGPARVFVIKEGKGRIGVISPLSNHFCNECNRLRFTSQGKLRPCLFSDKEYNLLGLLRNSKISLSQLKKVIELIGKNKPIGAHLLAERQKEVCLTKMVNIGG
ncbi:cyclic pyranopterin phosphate synthase [Desulfonauticus submarinus]|uniref:GTP 3',8-cyclase n=1 Tax=Desulfonauticus submarinus TaxID=206665 RepID=A0A1H0F7C4_9BACT|nr:GTP 3',8-cyclase MoaA [Desulfonauticus submarinus]SDN90505.1 cyclic pyranopterin phosphate synthase [Desulfonauticus submarinus]